MKKLASRLCVAVVVLILTPVAWTKSIIISEVDDREHRFIQLDNGLKVLLIHDAKADKAAAALDVYTGSADNPADRAGLAHFLEHMLFLGTKKYPSADEYQAFISANGGGHNAYTSIDNTNYFFDVQADALEPALDRFAQFFIAPLFTPEYVSRERNAVHSEYSASIKNDMRRSFDVLREVVNPDHPAAQFSVGNTDTLADRENDQVRDDLIQFYQTHYSSENMALVVLGRESLDELEALVVPRFNLVPKNKLLSARAAEALFTRDTLPLKLNVQPVKEVRSLSLIFPVPLLQPHYRQKPVQYITNLLGHEGQGSILDVLKQKGWAESLAAGSGYDDRYSSSVMINIRLTQEGLKHQDEVMGLFFEGVQKIKKRGVKRWRYREQEQLAALDFRYQEKQDPQSTVSYLASQLQQFPSEEVYRAPYIYDSFDKKLIESYLAKISPDNLFLMVMAPEVKTSKISHYYQVPYSEESLKGKVWAAPKELISQLALPKKNEFIPNNLALMASTKPAGIPQKQTTDNLAAWFKTDTSYGVPRGSIKIRTLLPNVTHNVKQSAQLALYERMVMESLNTFTYPATLAGLRFSLSASTRGLDIHISGYSDKQRLLLDKIITRLTDFKSLAPEFERLKSQVIRDWRNADKKPPYRQLFSNLSVAMFAPRWSVEEKLAAIKPVTEADMKAFVDRLYQGGTARVLVYGNYQQADADRVVASVETLLGDDQSGLIKATVVELDKTPTWWWLEVDHPDQALIGYLQGYDHSLGEQARMMLLQQILSADFFNQLRTEQQLGYIVFATSVRYKQVPGVAFVVQSPQASVVQIHQSIEQFLQGFQVDSEQVFAQHKAALLVDLQQAPKNLGEQAGIFWNDILQERWDFAGREAMINALSSISMADFNRYLQTGLHTNPRWLWLAAGEGNKQPDSIEWLKSMAKFKQEAQHYSYP